MLHILLPFVMKIMSKPPGMQELKPKSNDDSLACSLKKQEIVTKTFFVIFTRIWKCTLKVWSLTDCCRWNFLIGQCATSISKPTLLCNFCFDSPLISSSRTNRSAFFTYKVLDISALKHSQWKYTAFIDPVLLYQLWIKNVLSCLINEWRNLGESKKTSVVRIIMKEWEDQTEETG